MYNYCLTCLSYNRCLTKPSLEISEICEKIIPELNLTDRELCWECLNLLYRVKSFCKQVILTTNILKTHLKNDSNNILESKSKLHISNVQILNINPNVDINILYPNKEVNIYNDSKKRYLENKCSYFSIENNKNNNVIKEIREELNIINETEEQTKTNESKKEQKKTNFEQHNTKTVDDVFREMQIEALARNNNNTITSTINDNKINPSSLNENKGSKYTIKSKTNINKRNFKTVDEIIKEMENEKKIKNKIIENKTIINESEYLPIVSNDREIHHIDLLEDSDEKSNDTGSNNYDVTNKKAEKIGLRTKRKKRCKTTNFHCKICGQSFKTRGAYEYHKESHLQKKPFCVQCGKLFASKSVLWIHNNLVHKGVKSYNCEVCKRIFFTIVGYEAHVATHRVEEHKIFYCEPCEKFFKSNSTYRRHLRVSKQHFDPLTWKYKCGECDRSFQTEADRKHHRDVIHLNINKYKCQSCPKNYCNEKALKMHIRTKHEQIDSPKNKMCHICGEVFRSSQLLTLHTKTHHVSKNL